MKRIKNIYLAENKEELGDGYATTGLILELEGCVAGRV